MDFSLLLHVFTLAHLPTQHGTQFIDCRKCILIISLHKKPFLLIILLPFTMPSWSLPVLALKSPSMSTYELLSIQIFVYVDI